MRCRKADVVLSAATETRIALALSGARFLARWTRPVGRAERSGAAASSCDAPDSPLASIQIDLRPFCSPELPRSHKNQRRQSESRFDDVIPAVTVDRPEELRDFARLGNRRPVCHGDRRQGAPQVSRGIAQRPSPWQSRSGLPDRHAAWLDARSRVSRGAPAVEKPQAVRAPSTRLLGAILYMDTEDLRMSR